MRNRKRNKMFLWILIILGLTIGFAALTTTLKINGSAAITKNTWNIYWDNVANEKGVTPEAETKIGPDEDEVADSLVEFQVTFDKPGDYYEFTVDAVNAGTIDAELYLEKRYNDQLVPDNPTPENPSPVPSYIKYDITYADGSPIVQGAKLAKANGNTETRQTFKIRIEYDREAVTNEDINGQNEPKRLKFNLKSTYRQYYDPTPNPVSFATDSWATIAKAAKNPTTSGYSVGDTKNIEMDMNDDGINETYTVRIANLSTPAECQREDFSQTACGLVIEFTSEIDSHRMNGESASLTDPPTLLGEGIKGGWEYSDLRAYLNNGVYIGGTETSVDYTNTGLLAKLPSDLREHIVETKVVTGVGAIGYNQSTDVYTYDNNGENYITMDKLFLFSAHEVLDGNVEDDGFWIDEEDTAYYNSRQVDYYRDHNVTQTNYDAAIKEGAGGIWWLRTPSGSSYYEFFVLPWDYWVLSNYAGTPQGVSPAFKLG